MHAIKTRLFCLLLTGFSVSCLAAQTSVDAQKLDDELVNAHGELMRLPPLKDLLEIALRSAPENRKYDIAQEKEEVRKKLWRLANWDVGSVQLLGLTGRRDVFGVNTDGTVYVPTASVVDNMNTQASVFFKISPVSFFQHKRQVEILTLEQKRIDVEREITSRTTAEGVIYAYNMAQKSLDIMDARAEAVRLVGARAELAEKLFRQGAMSLVEYTEFQSAAAELTAKFQDSRGDFRLYYLMLMERVYGKIP